MHGTHRQAHGRSIRWLAIALGVLAVAAPGGATNDQPLVSAVESVGFTVSDMDRAVSFFTGVLTFERVSETETWGRPYELLHGLFGLRMRVVRLRLGEELLELTEYLAPRGRPFPVDTRSHDRWFQHVAIIVADMDRAYARLREHGVRHASTGPQRLPESIPAAAGIQAFYFRDPDGHFLEVLQFPEGKGPARWQTASDRLFLGIDHTAVVVEDTDASLAFYRDMLGLRVAGESENFGMEQEHLNNVFGARLRITTLRGNSGPGIELLQYLAPGDGRPAPADLRANDIAHWQTTVRGDTARAEAALIRVRASLVSPGAITLEGPTLGFDRGIMARDRDGHAIRIVQ